MDSEGSREQNLTIWVVFFLFVWVMVEFFHTSHSWSDDKVLLNHSGCMARAEAMILKG